MKLRNFVEFWLRDNEHPDPSPLTFESTEKTERKKKQDATDRPTIPCTTDCPEKTFVDA